MKRISDNVADARLRARNEHGNTKYDLVASREEKSRLFELLREDERDEWKARSKLAHKSAEAAYEAGIPDPASIGSPEYKQRYT